MNEQDLGSTAVGLVVALGCGLLIGLERERHKGRGADREPAGIRSFTLVAVGGALAQSLHPPSLVVAGALVVGALAMLGYWKSLADDPGLTTELALVVTYLVGVTAVVSPTLGAACGAGLAALLAARDQLHRLSTELLSDLEVRDLIILAGLALVALPLVPSGPQPWSGGIDPRRLASLVVLILVLQAAGHVATRWLGPRTGRAAAGFFSGFVSSTATVASMGTQARGRDAQVRSLASAAVMSSAATWVQSLLLAASLAPASVSALAPIVLTGILAAVGSGLLLAWGAPPAQDGGTPADSALKLREALVVALLLSGVALAVSWAQHRFGATGLYTGIALAAVADAHAPVATSAALFAAGRLGESALVHCLLLAVGVNTLTRTATAFAAGGRAFGLQVAAGLFAGTGSAVLAAWLLGHFSTASPT